MNKLDRRSWLLDPGCLIDRFLDHIEKLSSVVLPAQAGNPAYAKRPVEALIEPHSSYAAITQAWRREIRP
jgi:hypothetical protein